MDSNQKQCEINLTKWRSVIMELIKNSVNNMHWIKWKLILILFNALENSKNLTSMELLLSKELKAKKYFLVLILIPKVSFWFIQMEYCLIISGKKLMGHLLALNSSLTFWAIWTIKSLDVLFRNFISRSKASGPVAIKKISTCVPST